MPLILDKMGNKFGKSEGNALWLDVNKTSSYELYQYLINTDDDMVIHYLKVFTFLSVEEIEELEKVHKEHPELRKAQNALAHEIIKDLHGEEEYQKAFTMSKALFSGDVSNFSSKDIETVFKDLPKNKLDGDINIVDMLVNNNVCSSKREAREFITSGTISVNGEKVVDVDKIISKDLAIENKYIIVRRGKKKYYIFEF